MLFALDGAPHAGKSTTLNGLGCLGCPVMQEIASEVINEGVHQPWLGDEAQLAFQTEVARRQSEREAQLSLLDEDVYLDRGVVAAIAFRLIYGRALTDLHRGMTAHQYAAAFIFLPVEGWENDGVRYEDPDFSRAMTPVMKRVYESFGVPTVIVPNGTVAERMELISSCAAKVRPAARAQPKRGWLQMAA